MTLDIVFYSRKQETPIAKINMTRPNLYLKIFATLSEEDYKKYVNEIEILDDEYISTESDFIFKVWKACVAHGYILPHHDEFVLFGINKMVISY